MKGFKIKIEDREITAAIPSASCGVILTHARGKVDISIGGCTSDNWSYNWLRKDLQLGESISVLFTEVELSSEPLEVSDIFRRSKEEQIQIRTQNELKAYHQLRQELLDEGIIGPEE